jgi:hypothetical protein
LLSCRKARPTRGRSPRMGIFVCIFELLSLIRPPITRRMPAGNHDLGFNPPNGIYVRGLCLTVADLFIDGINVRHFRNNLQSDVAIRGYPRRDRKNCAKIGVSDLRTRRCLRRTRALP